MTTGTYRALFTRVVYTEWIFFGLMAIGLMILRRKPEMRGSFRIRGYPLIPVLFVVSSFAIVINQILSDPRESLFGLLLVIAGLPVYYVWTGRTRKGG